jgi:cytosine/adenosine deaminase-related metal-dependent hydrolase
MDPPAVPSSEPAAPDPLRWPDRWRITQVRIWTGAAERPLLTGDLEVRDGRIAALGASLPPPDPGVVCLPRPGRLLLPGFVQSHLHLCQMLFRGSAEGLRLDRWLIDRILPLEACHDADTLRASADLGIAEALRSGATTIVDMGTVHHTEIIAECAREGGVRAVVGKALIDVPGGTPPTLVQESTAALTEALDLHAAWDGAADGRIRVALAPRFALSVSALLWRRIAAEARRRDLLVHTHVSETPWENETCRQMHGDTPVRSLESWGVLAARTLLVHAIWTDAEERALLAARPSAVVHCPGSNAKLGSGILDLPALRAAGVPVALGSDGAACNDELAPQSEMRLAAQLQSLQAGPGQVPAGDILRLATVEGARAVGLLPDTGRLAPGCAADLQLYDPAACGWEPDADPAHALVFAGSAARPAAVFVDGQPRIWGGELIGRSLEDIRRAAAEARREIHRRFDAEREAS